MTTLRTLARLAVRRLLVTLGAAHDDPHFECLTERPDDPCDGVNEPGVGHVCVCSCRRCDLAIRRDYDVCVCPACDARACGLHEAAPPVETLALQPGERVIAGTSPATKAWADSWLTVLNARRSR